MSSRIPHSAPARRFELSSRYRRPVAGPGKASREVGCSPECCERRPCRLIGLPAATRRRGFPRELVAPPPASSPVLSRARVHPLLSLASSSEFCASSLPPVRIRRAPSLRFCLPIATSAAEIHTRARHHPRRFGPPPAFRTPSTVFALHCLVGLFHPTATSGIRLTGACSRHPAWSASSAVRALLSLPTFACRELPLDSGSDDLGSRAFLRVAIRGDRRGS